jgi:AcrR family transcriptional regulator
VDISSDSVGAEERERRVQQPLARAMVQTARELMGQYGVAGVTVRAIQTATQGSTPGKSAAPGSLHYYFGSRERVLIEVLRVDVHDHLSVLAQSHTEVASFEQLLDALHEALDTFVAQASSRHVVVVELVGEALRNPQLAGAQAALYDHWRAECAAMLERLEQRGVVSLRGRAAQVAELLTAISQGLAIQQQTNALWDRRPALALTRELLREALQSPR